MVPMEQDAMVPTQQHQEEETETEKPKYQLTKKNIRQIAVEISKSNKSLESTTKGKGKHNIILQEISEDEDELNARVADILIDAAKNKVSIEEQFKRFVEEEERQSKAKKVKITKPPAIEPIDLVSTPPPPSPTQIIQEDTSVSTNISPTDLYNNAML